MAAVIGVAIGVLVSGGGASVKIAWRPDDSGGSTHDRLENVYGDCNRHCDWCADIWGGASVR